MNGPSTSTALASSASSSTAASSAVPISLETMQRLLDESAYFNLVAVPRDAGTRATIYGPNQTIIGFRADHDLHRFGVTTQPPEVANGIQAANVVGEKIGHCTQRWMLIPDATSTPCRAPSRILLFSIPRVRSALP